MIRIGVIVKFVRELATEQRKVVDATENSIESGAMALKALTDIGRKKVAQLLVYGPAAKPLDDEDKQKDPFALYGACGGSISAG